MKRASVHWPPRAVVEVYVGLVLAVMHQYGYLRAAQVRTECVKSSQGGETTLIPEGVFIQALFLEGREWGI
jgi:hypothetical protein